MPSGKARALLVPPGCDVIRVPSLARAIVAPEFGERLEPHDSFHIGADVFYTFLVANPFPRHPVLLSCAAP